MVQGSGLRLKASALKFRLISLVGVKWSCFANKQIANKWSVFCSCFANVKRDLLVSY